MAMVEAKAAVAGKARSRDAPPAQIAQVGAPTVASLRHRATTVEHRQIQRVAVATNGKNVPAIAQPTISIHTADKAAGARAGTTKGKAKTPGMAVNTAARGFGL